MSILEINELTRRLNFAMERQVHWEVEAHAEKQRAEQLAGEVARLQQRLRDISVSLSDAGVNGGTVQGGVLSVIRDKEAAEGEVARLREQLTTPAT